MNVAVKKIGNSKLELNIQTGKDTVRDKYEQVYSQIAKEAKVSGFRPGKVPRDILEKRFSDTAKSSVTQGLVEDLYRQAIEEQKIFAISHPEVSDIVLKNDGFSFKAIVEIKPEVKVAKYKGVNIKREKVEVTDEKIKEMLENIKKDKDTEEINDDFAKSLGYPSLSNLKEVVKNQLFITASESARRKHEGQLVDFLIKHSELDLPQSLIDRELKERVNMAEYRLMQQGVKKEDIEQKKKDLDKNLKESVAKDIKVYFILDKIAALENIKIDDKQSTSKVMEFLLKEAKWVE